MRNSKCTSFRPFEVDLTSLQLEGRIRGKITPGDRLSIVQLRVFSRMSQAKQVDNKVQVNKIQTQIYFKIHNVI